MNWVGALRTQTAEMHTGARARYCRMGPSIARRAIHLASTVSLFTIGKRWRPDWLRSRAHAMLADSGWTGAPLSQIVSEELTSFSNQFECVGCELVLDTPSAQSFSLIVHELATNAVKHGALSRPEGRVAITGSVLLNENSELFRFNWTESGGPAVTAPGRKGFGSSILSTMAKRFACRVAADYRQDGLVYELQVPLNSILACPKPAGTPAFWRSISVHLVRRKAAVREGSSGCDGPASGYLPQE